MERWGRIGGTDAAPAGVDRARPLPPLPPVVFDAAGSSVGFFGSSAAAAEVGPSSVAAAAPEISPASAGSRGVVVSAACSSFDTSAADSVMVECVD